MNYELSLEFWAIILQTIGIFIALWMLIASLKNQNQNLKNANTIQQTSLMHDMVKEEIANWKYIHEQKERYDKLKKKVPKSVKEHIFNYYEYLAYLINHKNINRKCAFEVWRSNIFGMYETFEDEFLRNRTELRKLYKRWEKLDKQKRNNTPKMD